MGLIKKTPKEIITITDEGTVVAESVMNCDENCDKIIKKDLTEEEYINL